MRVARRARVAPRSARASRRDRRRRVARVRSRGADDLAWDDDDDAARVASLERRSKTPLRVDARATPARGDPVVALFSRDVARAIGLDADEASDATFARRAAGEASWRGDDGGARGSAWAYAGHQFGAFAGLLGDGRAIAVGSVAGRREAFESGVESDDARASGGDARVEVQLKGAGRTAYSRGGDGRATLRSSAREFVASEAMAALGVPTTRALCVAATNDGVTRATASASGYRLEAGGVLTRVSTRGGLVRFGSFEWPASRGDDEGVRALADYVVECSGAFGEDARRADGAVDYGGFLRAVARKTGALAAKWQCVGFVHGVLNTDNMSVLGLTLDYGPYGFMEAFDYDYVSNASDDTGMYSYAKQPSAVRWNVDRLCDAFARVAPRGARAEALRAYDEAFEETTYAQYTKKFGVRVHDATSYGDVVARFHRALHRGRFDFTRSHRLLGAFATCVSARGEAMTAPALCVEMFAQISGEQGRDWASVAAADPALVAMIEDFGASYADAILNDDALGRDATARRSTQDSSNPAVVPRNHILARVIADGCDADDWRSARAFIDALATPFEDPTDAAFARPATDAELARHGRLSCSS